MLLLGYPKRYINEALNVTVRNIYILSGAIDVL